MRWSYDDNYNFTKDVIDVFFYNKENIKASIFIRRIAYKYVFSYNSLRWKLSNVKYLFNSCKSNPLRNTLNIKGATHASKDNEKAFREILKIE